MKSRRKPLTRIQKFARGKPCSLRVPGVCRQAPENENVCLCHAPYPGRYGSRKDDHWAAPGCFECHDFMDGRGPYVFGLQGREEIWQSAIHEWQAMLIDEELMTVGAAA